MAIRTRDVPRDLITRLLDSPDLPRIVQSLEPVVLHALVRKCGLEDCGPIVSLATTEQLMRVFDEDLWHAPKAGREETFDADRFGLWLEVLVEAGAETAARTLASLDFDFVTAALHRHVLVLDPESLALERAAAELYDELDPAEEERIEQVETALEGGVSCEVGGYRVVARRAEGWDAVVSVLAVLDADHHAFFGRLMARCGVLSTEWIVDNGGLYDVLTSDVQVLADVAGERGERREEQGYVDPPLAVAFLRLAREPIAGAAEPPARDHVTAPYFRRLDRRAKRQDDGQAPPRGTDTPRPEAGPEVQRLLATLQDAGVLPPARPPLLTPVVSDERDRLARIRAHLVRLREEDDAAHARQTAELGYLANVLVAGCSFQSRRFRSVEAADAVLAVCNLGLESWPRRWPAARDLVTVFRIGWSVLHESVCLHAARRLAETLAGVKTADAAVRSELLTLVRRIEAHADAPWRVRDGLDVVAVLDAPSWATLLGLLDECPTVPRRAETPAGRTAPRVTPEFDFISEREQVVWARGFAASLPERLRG